MLDWRNWRDWRKRPHRSTRGAGDKDSKLFSRFTDESGGSGLNCLIVKLIGERETAIGYNKGLEEKNTLRSENMVAIQRNLNIAALEAEYSQKTPREILKFALENFDNISISFSGAEDVVLIDMASKITKNFRVFTLDTGRLHSETYPFLDQVRKWRYFCFG